MNMRGIFFLNHGFALILFYFFLCDINAIKQNYHLPPKVNPCTQSTSSYLLHKTKKNHAMPNIAPCHTMHPDQKKKKLKPSHSARASSLHIIYMYFYFFFWILDADAAGAAGGLAGWLAG